MRPARKPLSTATALLALSIAAASAALSGCGGTLPPPVLTHADQTTGLRVRIADKSDYLGNGENEEHDDENRKAIAGAQHALVLRLQEAGYVVAEKGPYDVSAGTSFSIKRPRHEDAAFARARLRLKDRKGEVVEEITMEFRNHAVPAAEPDRVAVILVNELNKSPKVAALVKKRDPAASAEPAPAPPAAPSP
jgi:hypothetical protein